MLVTRDGNTLVVNSLDNYAVVDDFIRQIKDCLEKGYQDINISFSNCGSYFPNTVVPISGLIDLCRETQNVDFSLSGLPRAISNNILTPLDVTTDSLSNGTVLNKIWKFREDNLHKLHREYLNALSREEHFHKGLIESIDWSLGETLDNVLLHSNIECGYVMGQIHKTRHYITFTIFDYGQGIYNSFRASQYTPPTTLDAITLALREGITSGKGKGNGLFGLHSIVKLGKGILNITSGSGRYGYVNGHEYSYDHIPYFSKENNCTLIDFQLDYNSQQELSSALIFQGKRYDMVNLRLDELQDELGVITYEINKESDGTGTRKAAKAIYSDIMNLLEYKPSKVIIDFAGTNVVSSSYADELIAKLFIKLGLFQFNNLIILRNIEHSQQIIFQRAVFQRLTTPEDTMRDDEV